MYLNSCRPLHRPTPYVNLCHCHLALVLSPHTQCCSEPIQVKTSTRTKLIIYTPSAFIPRAYTRPAQRGPVAFISPEAEHRRAGKLWGTMQKSTKVKITFVVILIGIVCMFTAVVTDHWAVLSHQVNSVNSTCEAAHFGLWRLCKKHIYIDDPETVGKGCGPISLPGGKSCWSKRWIIHVTCLLFLYIHHTGRCLT